MRELSHPHKSGTGGLRAEVGVTPSDVRAAGTTAATSGTLTQCVCEFE